jgi:hypothetical protein
MDNFYRFLKEKRIFYLSTKDLFLMSRDSVNQAAAVVAELKLNLLDDIITQYEKFVKETEGNVENLS